MMEHNDGPCSEPEGNELQAIECGDPENGPRVVQEYAHDLMIERTGSCPWCGESDPYADDPAYRQYLEEETAIHEGRAIRLTHCYLCYLEETGKPDFSPKQDQGPLRGIMNESTMRTHPTHPEADVYGVQHLSCGHAII